MDNFIEADFIGGIWDGKTYAIPVVPEWKVAIMHSLNVWDFSEEIDSSEPVPYDIAVYRNMGHGIFWLSRIEKL